MRIIFLCWLTIFGFVISLVENALTIPIESNKSVGRVKRQNQNQYTTIYDDFDVDGVLKSTRLMKSYIKCLLDKGPCTKEGRELKKNLPDALQTDCSKCSDVQKRQGGKVLSIVLQNHRKDWDALLAKYDPTGIFRKKYGYNANEQEEDEDDEGDVA